MMRDFTVDAPEFSQYLIYFRRNGLPDQALYSAATETDALLEFIRDNPGVEGAHVKAGPLQGGKVVNLMNHLLARAVQ